MNIVTHRIITAAWGLAALLASAAMPTHATVRESVEQPAGAYRYVLTEREGTQPSRVLVVLTGGDGVLGLQQVGDRLQAPGSGDGRSTLAESVGAVASVDFVQPLPFEARNDQAHIKEMGQLLSHVASRYPSAKLFLLGMSNGALTAANVAAAQGERLAGVILVSASGYAINREKLDPIKAPILIVHHKRDSCTVWKPIADVAKWHNLLLVDDENMPRPQSGDARQCGPDSAHQFGEKRRAVWRAVADWINTGKTVAQL